MLQLTKSAERSVQVQDDFFQGRGVPRDVRLEVRINSSSNRPRCLKIAHGIRQLDSFV